MAKDCVAIVKVRDNETGERKREKICYIRWSARYLLSKHEYFMDYMKTLLKLEKHLTGKDVNYELELVDDEEIAAEQFNREMKNESTLPMCTYASYFTMLYIEYLKGKTDDKYLLNLLKKLYDRLNLYSNGGDEYYELNRYVDEIVKVKSTKKNNKR